MKNIFAAALLLILISSCKREKEPDLVDETGTTTPGLTSSTPVKGYEILSELSGIWSGQLTSTTALGSFTDWTVDLRPISSAQVSSKNELDSLNDIFMSFFVTLYNNEYQISFRNGGGFNGNSRTSFLKCDSTSISGNSKYFRFSDFKMGIARAYVEFTFRNDSLYMKTYTNQYNSVNPATLHMSWQAKLQDTTTAQNSKTLFSFPQKVLVKDLSNSFSGLSESIFYNNPNDAYPESQQPYLGITNVNVSYSGALTIAPGTFSYIIFTSQPLFSGTSFNSGNLKYRCRYVRIPVADQNFVFNYMHPGDYYLYVLHDADGNGTFSSGDHINSPLSLVSFNLGDKENKSLSVNVNFTVP